MMSRERPRVLVVGAGAVGGFYGSLLARAGAQVSVVCRSDAAQIKKTGFQICSPLGNDVFHPQAVYCDAAEYPQSPDYLLLTVKVLDNLNRVALIRQAVGQHTAIVVLENGIDVESEIASAFPDNEIISALAFVCVSRTGPGEIDHQAYGDLTIGGYPQGSSAQVQALAAMFCSQGIACTVSEDVVTARWRKSVWNVPFNSASVLAGGATTRQILESSGGEAWVRAVMAEVCAIAAASGHPLPPDVVEKHLTQTYAMPPYHTSMALDYLHGRPMEVEAILGNAARRARQYGVTAPQIFGLYALMKIVQKRLVK